VNEIPTGDWYKLPNLDLNLLLQSQRIKRIISGDLNARLVTNPEFDGREKEFLRAQIARIVHSTTLIPEGLYDKDDEGTGIVLKEEPDVKATGDLNSHENWVYARPGILPSGHLKAKEVEGDDDDDNANKEAREQTMERLLKLETDKDSWKIALQGLPDIHKLDGKDVS
jgi:hypothetical protein